MLVINSAPFASQSVTLPFEDACRINGQNFSVIATGNVTMSAQVPVTAIANYPGAKGQQTLKAVANFIVIDGRHGFEDASLFSMKNLPALIGSAIGIVVIIIVLITAFRYWRQRKLQPAVSFGRFTDEATEPDTTTTSKFTISDNENAQGYLGSSDQLLPKDNDIELTTKVSDTLSEAGPVTKPSE